jgi:methyl-accepting chemotaxis protein
MVGVLTAGLVATKTVNSKLEQIVKVNNAKTDLAQDFRTWIRTASLCMFGSIATKDEALRDQSLKALAVTREKYMSFLEKLEKIEDTEKGRQIIKGIKENMSAAKGKGGTVMELANAGRNEEAVAAYLARILSNVHSSNDAAGKLIAFQQEDAGRRYEEAKSSYRRSIMVLAIMGAVIIAVAVLTTVFLTRSITEPINRSIRVSTSLGEGKLNIDMAVDRKDEFGQEASAINNMVEKWRRIISNVKQASDSIASASTQLSAGAEQMSKGANQQADRARQVATASQEMSQTVIDVATNASNIATTATRAATTAKDGGKIVEEAVKEVKEIAVTVEESSGHITSLADLSERIGKIIGIIDDIADQTNLLALNAAIEAARAGDHGRGFAVVADEVRKLAERTTSATSEVGIIIKEIQNRVGSAVSSIEHVSVKVDRGVDLSSRAGTELKNIVDGVEDLQAMVQQIASAIEEMSATSDQISKDIDSISAISYDTSQSSNEVSKASLELSTLGVGLQSISKEFEL